MTILIALLTTGGYLPPDTVDLATCYKSAERHFPTARRTDLAERIAELEIRNIDARYRPDVMLEGRGVYHSSVPELPVDLPGAQIPGIPHDQYTAALHVNQVIYDGGVGGTARRLAETSVRATEGEVGVALHELKTQINDVFFGALIQREAAATLGVLRDELQARRAAILARIDQGVVSGEALDVLDVELLSVDQRIETAEQTRRGALAALSVLTGLNLSDDVTLVVPDVDVSAPEVVADHPQFTVFETRRKRLTLQREQIRRRAQPTIGAFATGAYGRPAGMDIFEDALSPYFSMGVRLSWSVWDWRSADRDRQVIGLQEDAVDAQEDAFVQRVQASAERAWQEVERLRALVERDVEIESLRTRIAERAARRFENGVISATEYVTERHAEHRAALDSRRHEIELRYAMVRYQTLLGQADEYR
ncbi:MAG: TolC family protein [Rhodothermales bacterium]